jgi:hypothetical protein
VGRAPEIANETPPVLFEAMSGKLVAVVLVQRAIVLPFAGSQVNIPKSEEDKGRPAPEKVRIRFAGAEDTW